MKKLTLILILLVLPLLLTGCIKKPATENQSTTQTNIETDEVESVTGTISDLLGLNKSQMCTAEYENEEGNVKTTVYVSGEKSYTESDIVSPDSETAVKSYAIFDGEWFYMWGDYGMATKMKMDDMQDMAEDVKDMVGDVSESQDLSDEIEAYDQEMDYNCKPWRADNSKFVPPQDVEFVDIAETMKNFMDTDAVKEMMGGSGCQICDSMPDAASKAECKTSLGCE